MENLDILCYASFANKYIFSKPRSFGVRTTPPRRSSSGVVAPTPLFIRGSLNMYANNK